MSNCLLPYTVAAVIHINQEAEIQAEDLAESTEIADYLRTHDVGPERDEGE